MNKLTNIFALAICCLSLDAQTLSQSDCIDAIVLCNHDPINVTAAINAGNDESELDGFQDRCMDYEFQSSWFKWTCNKSGMLTILLTPDDYTEDVESDDLDFAVFELLIGMHNCAAKEMLRCMASGQTVGCEFDQWKKCNGPTGLSDNSSDNEEFPGCNACNGGSDDNFLAPLEMEAGKSYALMVMQSSRTDKGFTLELGGTGGLSTDNTDCHISSNNNLAQILDLTISPNPANDWIDIKAKDYHPLKEVTFYSTDGTRILTKKLSANQRLNIETWSPGLYYYVISGNAWVQTGKVIKS